MTHLAFKTRLNFEPSLPLPRVFFSQNSDTRTLGHSDTRTLGHSDTRILNFPALLRYFGQLFISKWPRSKEQRFVAYVSETDLDNFKSDPPRPAQLA